MKKSTEESTAQAQGKTNSTKVPLTANKTARTQKTSADERNEPSFMSDEEVAPEPASSALAEEPAGTSVSAQASEDAAGGFHPPALETRRERHTHDKGEVEGASMSIKSRIPPVQKPGDPGGAPRIHQRRSIHERGNRYPLTHAPKA